MLLFTYVNYNALLPFVTNRVRIVYCPWIVITFFLFKKTKTLKKLSVLLKYYDTVIAKHAILFHFPAACPRERNKVLNFVYWIIKCITINLHTPAGFPLLSVSLVVSVCHFLYVFEGNFNVIWHPEVKILKAMIWREHCVLLKKVTTR